MVLCLKNRKSGGVSSLSCIVCFFDRSVHRRRMFYGVSDAGTYTALMFCDAEKCKLSQKT